jgi:hypothetical protein
MFGALPRSSSGGLRRNCIYAASDIVTLFRWLSCAPVKKELQFMVLVNSGLHKQKNLSENYPQREHASITSDASPMLVQKKKFKECRSEGTSNY